jgi:hypothetical protein
MTALALRQPRQPRRHTEANLQTVLIQHIRTRARRDIFAFAIPNGGLRSSTEAMRFKAQGVVAGVPDLCIIVDGRAHFLELKAPGGRLSDVQRFVMRKLDEAGAVTATAVGIDEALATLDQWGVFR